MPHQRPPRSADAMPAEPSKGRGRLRPHLDVAELRSIALKEGMEPLRISGARKVHAGLTTVEEVLRVAPLVDEA